MNLSQLPLKRLTFVKTTPNRILLLCQDPSSSAWNCFLLGHSSLANDNPISVNRKRSIFRSPRGTKVVPISIMNLCICTAVTKSIKLTSNTLEIRNCLYRMRTFAGGHLPGDANRGRLSGGDVCRDG